MLNEPALWADIVFPLVGSSSSNPSAPTEVLDSLPIQSTSIDTTALALDSSESEVEMDYTRWDPIILSLAIQRLNFMQMNQKVC